MLHRLQSMIGYAIRATDGDVGKVHEFYFDDTNWTIRYMVAKTGSWLSGRKVLISLIALGKPDWELHIFSVNHTCLQVRKSPDIDTDRPVYRHHEAALHEHYQWPQYWGGGYGGTFGITPYPLFEEPLIPDSVIASKQEDTHLRSTHQITGYHIHATDGDIGHVTDLIVDDTDWVIRYLVVDTGNWLPGKKVLLPTNWIKDVNWTQVALYLDQSRESVKNCPEFDSAKIIHQDYAVTGKESNT